MKKNWHVWIVHNGFVSKQVFCFNSQMSAIRWAKKELEGKGWKVRECKPTEQGGICKAPPTRVYNRNHNKQEGN